MLAMDLPSIGDKEHVALQAVWRLGRCTVRQVFEEVGEPDGLAYTTIATVLDRSTPTASHPAARGKDLLLSPGKAEGDRGARASEESRREGGRAGAASRRRDVATLVNALEARP